VVDGAKDNEYGVILRLNTVDGDDEFYSFGVSSMGKYSFWLRQGGQWTDLIAWTANPAIKTRKGDINHISVVVNGSDFTFFVNGEQIDTHFDTSIERGKTGLYAASTAAGEMTVTFDNLVLTKPPQ
jgi:hypothetical protein